jgi:hypothetical protein
MSPEKYIGMDVHQATISVAVMDAGGKLIMECLLETKAATIVEFIRGLHGTLSLTFEEGTSAAWLHDLLKPYVSRLVVCDPRKNALLKDGNKSDRIDARKLAELLRGNQLHPVYHGEHGVRTLKELGRSYLTITQDVTRPGRVLGHYRTCGNSYCTLYQITARLIIVQADFFAAFTFAHRARCAAAILLRALADIGRFRILDYGPKMYVAPGP